jgi:hypothetical protein
LSRRALNVSSLHCHSPNVPELHKISLFLFPNLMEIRLDMCPISSVAGIYNLKHQLQYLEVMNTGITDLADALIPYISDKQMLLSFKPYLSTIEASALMKSPVLSPTCSKLFNKNGIQFDNVYAWNKLSTLKLINCGLCRMDESLHMFPCLSVLDLSKNQLSYVAHLQDCQLLKHLNLSQNRIKSLLYLSRVALNITNLNVANNQIQILEGLDKLQQLEKVDISGNIIDNFVEIRYLNRLPNLLSVNLTENPIAKHPQYRLMVYNEFATDGTLLHSKRNLPYLDGLAMTHKEYKALRYVLAYMRTCIYIYIY